MKIKRATFASASSNFPVLRDTRVYFSLKHEDASKM